ncbi:ParB/RepB/Spo0J family partition protein [Asticcacaulis endophyticus]|uniref:Chromosome partitioning protein ParB n=1 Tax=Asticcacaulis endophyticus TaxID=1395890 RepID=A0A918UTH6_9CAUL|nr:ParB/RepB/Spo0J family partition protein [Asticcacaulis endophyticus]GGZ32770.1 chromosome partitioning protein ParB [Asticcacaulis endophyticus]
MNKPLTKLILSPSRDIPFEKLRLTQSNVRRIKAGQSIAELAEDIGRRTLLQSLSVRPILDDKGVETGLYSVPAGGRRYRALELLVKQKRLAKDAPVNCIVREDGIAEEDSLAENTHRLALHPLDQYRAFKTLVDQGLSEEDIAARFFVSVTVVKQRLKLASVAPSLLDIYADDGMALEQLMAFSVTDDHARQEMVWQAIQGISWQQEPYHIRRHLTENSVAATNKRVRFVGLDAYVEAGGIVERDLFNDDAGGFLQDPVLLDTLVADKLRSAAETLSAEGWKWAEIAIDLPYGHANGLRKLKGTPEKLSAAEQTEYDALREELDTLLDDYADEEAFPEAVDERLGVIEAAIERYQNRPTLYDPADIARGGIFLTIAHDGALKVDRAYIRPEDEAAPETSADDGVVSRSVDDDGITPTTIITAAGERQPAEDEDDDDPVKPLPDRLLGELTTYRTVALRNALANNPHVALTALLHKLAGDLFLRDGGGCLEARIFHPSLQAQGPDLKDSPSAQAITQRHETWQALVPGNESALWSWVDGLDETTRMALLAHCVSFGVNALHQKIDKYGNGTVTRQGLQARMGQADRLSAALDLDLVVSGWRPTTDNYLGRVTKPHILQAVREARGEQFVGMIDHLKKGDMAAEAERLLDGTGWLPAPLQMSGISDREPHLEPDAGMEVGDDLPSFLMGDMDDDISGDEDSPDPEDEAAGPLAAE